MILRSLYIIRYNNMLGIKFLWQVNSKISIVCLQILTMYFRASFTFTSVYHTNNNNFNNLYFKMFNITIMLWSEE